MSQFVFKLYHPNRKESYELTIKVIDNGMFSDLSFAWSISPAAGFAIAEGRAGLPNKKGREMVIIAPSGTQQITEDKSFFVLRLPMGHPIGDLRPGNKGHCQDGIGLLLKKGGSLNFKGWDWEFLRADP